MSTIQDYLQWRGDILFSQVPFNELDMYILAKIGVPELGGIVPESGPGLPLSEAYRKYYSRTDIDPDYFGRLNLPVLTEMLRSLPKQPRFKELELSDYLQKYSEKRVEQISALTIRLPDGPRVVTFRGTDDTIVGWKENFLMAVTQPVPAQRDALVYLVKIAEQEEGPLLVCGHSKGGNLAVYAAAMAPERIQNRILGVYNFDGPGFQSDFWKEPGVQRVKEKTFNFVSQHTMVGTLLTQARELTVCRSTKSGPVAHELLNWEVMGTHFVRERSLSRASKEFDQVLNKQVAQMSKEEIRDFVEEFFGVLTSTGATTLTEFSRQPVDKLWTVVREMNSSPRVKEFVKSAKGIFFEDTPLIGKKKKDKKS